MPSEPSKLEMLALSREQYSCFDQSQESFALRRSLLQQLGGWDGTKTFLAVAADLASIKDPNLAGGEK